MIRWLFLYLSKVSWAKKIIMNWKFAKKASSRFVAGENKSQAIQVSKDLNQQGFVVALDPLGEHSESLESANSAVKEILDLIEKININQIDAYVSIKLTQLGLVFDKESCLRNLEKILEKAKNTNVFIRVDMEDSSITEETISVVSWMKSVYPRVGIVIQSYLYRSMEDIKTLANKKISIRMVKGAYKEPKEIAFSNKKDVDLNFDRLSKKIITDTLVNKTIEPEKFHNPSFLALATHDEKRIKEILEFARNHGVAQADLEIQMLYGIRRDLQQKYLGMGYPVRIYVPYGPFWYPYFMRRLAERPANVWFFVSNLFKK